nr:MAG TPA: hypothetical protein [Caudoviricetes sp.]
MQHEMHQNATRNQMIQYSSPEPAVPGNFNLYIENPQALAQGFS